MPRLSDIVSFPVVLEVHLLGTSNTTERNLRDPQVRYKWARLYMNASFHLKNVCFSEDALEN